MKKILFLAFCSSVVTHPLAAMHTRSLETNAFHSDLITNQITKMIDLERTDELKLWLDTVSQAHPIPKKLLSALKSYANIRCSILSFTVLQEFRYNH